MINLEITGLKITSSLPDTIFFISITVGTVSIFWNRFTYRVMKDGIPEDCAGNDSDENVSTHEMNESTEDKSF